ncbi:DUF1361 domain-containing protein [Gorillibacterium sp. sgz5001074]|uniref:DUF1361 domain-containing protein n=1 Tax=Gorillibacterium sp. sgz5001074 TaxID=3446695 RepID=UPI003F66BEBB
MYRSDWIRWYAGFVLATAAGCLWVLYRVKISGTGFYTFMIWNLFLAWIPMWAGTAWHWLGTSPAGGSIRRAVRWALGGSWLLFLPNASYVVTDLIHFTYVRGKGLWPWSDLFMLVLFAWISLLLGYVSLYVFHHAVRRKYGWPAGWGFSFTVLVLQAVGVYVGRELRWNSWWVLTDPHRMLADLPVFLEPEPYRFIAMAGVFGIMGYLMIYSFLYRPGGQNP